MIAINNRCLKSRGDTLIEVLFAISIFSLVAVGALLIMNQGMATSQRALEVTLVRQEIDSQAETLRFLNESYAGAYRPGTEYRDYYNSDSSTKDLPAAQWALMMDKIDGAANGDQISNFGLTDDNGCLIDHSNYYSFILDTRNAKFFPPSGILTQANTFSKVSYNTTTSIVGGITTITTTLTGAEGIWIEAKHEKIDTNNQNNAAYVDFHIRACWESPGQSIPITLGTIVRLYEPRG